MRKRVQVALAFLLVATAGVIVWQGLREREPVYEGKPLSVWLQCYNTHGSFIGLRPEPKADEAVRQIGTNAIPTFLHMLRAPRGVCAGISSTNRLSGTATYSTDYNCKRVTPCLHLDDGKAVPFVEKGDSLDQHGKTMDRCD